VTYSGVIWTSSSNVYLHVKEQAYCLDNIIAITRDNESKYSQLYRQTVFMFCDMHTVLYLQYTRFKFLIQT